MQHTVCVLIPYNLNWLVLSLRNPFLSANQGFSILVVVPRLIDLNCYVKRIPTIASRPLVSANCIIYLPTIRLENGVPRTRFAYGKMLHIL